MFGHYTFISKGYTKGTGKRQVLQVLDVLVIKLEISICFVYCNFVLVNTVLTGQLFHLCCCRSCDFLPKAFELFPDCDFCVISVPHLVPEFPLLQQFVVSVHVAVTWRDLYYYYYYIRLMTLFSRTTWVSRHQKGKPFWILLEWEMMEWQWLQLDHMHIIAPPLSRQITTHASTSPLSFYRPDALPAAQPTASKHWKHDVTWLVI